MNLLHPGELEALGADLLKLADDAGLMVADLQRYGLLSGNPATIRLVSQRLQALTTLKTQPGTIREADTTQSNQ